MAEKKPLAEPVDARTSVDEADIGSGEKTPGQLETEKMIQEIPALPKDKTDAPAQP